MLSLAEFTGIDAVDPAQWAELTRAADLDAAAGFLRFREYLEPGDSFLLVVRDGGRLRGALHGACSVPASGLSSDPWKFLAADAVLRLDGDPSDEDVRRSRAAIVRTLAGADGSGTAPLWSRLADRLGPCLVVREFDASRLVSDPDLTPAESSTVADTLVRAAQDLTVRRGAGALCFPYVETGNRVLRAVLADRGFRGGVMTAASRLSTAGFADHEAFLGSLPSRRRRIHRREEDQLRRADGLHLSHLELADAVPRVAVLEANTLAKHGGTVAPETLHRARAEMLRCLPGAAFVPAVTRHGEPIACAVHLVGRRNLYFLAYGCDYTVEDRSHAYPWAAFYSPVRRAVAAGCDAVLLGLEGLEAKSRRGAAVEPRETWIWMPERAAFDGVTELLGLVTARTTAYLERFR